MTTSDEERGQWPTLSREEEHAYVRRDRQLRLARHLMRHEFLSDSAVASLAAGPDVLKGRAIRGTLTPEHDVAHATLAPVGIGVLADDGSRVIVCYADAVPVTPRRRAATRGERQRVRRAKGRAKRDENRAMRAAEARAAEAARDARASEQRRAAGSMAWLAAE